MMNLDKTRYNIYEYNHIYYRLRVKRDAMEKVAIDTKQITIEFTNLARVQAGAREVEQVFPQGATYADIIEWLAQAYPDLVGIIIQADHRSFTNSTMFIINNEMGLPAMILDELPKDGNRLTIVSVPTGG